MTRNRLWQKTLNLLLSALALGWGLIPQGVQHSHAGGMDPTHRHGVRDQVAHHESHCHASGVGDREHATERDVFSSPDSTAHLHWRLLGLKFSMPLPEQPADGAEYREMVPPTIVRTLDRVASGTRVGPSSDWAFPLHAAVASSDAVDKLTATAGWPTAVTSIPLCDVARRELCGVLLA